MSLLSLLVVSNGIPQSRDIIYGNLNDNAFFSQLKKLKKPEILLSADTPKAVNQLLLQEIKEIYPIVKPPYGVTPCNVYLLKGRLFSSSPYFQGQYIPPAKCGTVSLNLIMFSITLGFNYYSF